MSDSGKQTAYCQHGYGWMAHYCDTCLRKEVEELRAKLAVTKDSIRKALEAIGEPTSMEVKLVNVVSILGSVSEGSNP